MDHQDWRDQPSRVRHRVDLIDALLARCRFPAAGTAVTCAVSGGADSMALLILARAAECEVTAVHVDHGLRVGSDAEADVVAAAAERFGADFRAERVSIVPGSNLEARAREARYGVLPPDVLTGHTADDQAETILLNLMRGAALDGLAGIRPERRPILALRRFETVGLCEELGLEPIMDPSNQQPVHRRNRVRHELLPLMNDLVDRDVTAVLARQAPLVRDAVDYIAEAASPLDPTDARALATAPVALARVALRRWIGAVTQLGHPVGSAAVERALSVARLEATSADLVAGWRIARTAGRLRIERR